MQAPTIPQKYAPFPKPKLLENKPINSNVNRDYEDEQAYLVPKGVDSSQVRDLKGKIKLVMTKLTTVKKQRDELQKSNKVLQDEVTSLQANLREMVAGFSNTSSSFPTYNEIGSRFAEFYKYECLDFFFDVLSSEMSMKGIIYFYLTCFERVDYLIRAHFSPCLAMIGEVGCFQSIEGPIMNVLRKAFQTTHSEIIAKIKNSGKVQQIVELIQGKLRIGEEKQDINQSIQQFLEKIVQLSLYCYVSDPPFALNYKQIGQRVQFNPLLHDPFDGFIKPKEDCWIVLPSVRKTNQDHSLIAKSQVLQVGYDQIN